MAAPPPRSRLARPALAARALAAALAYGLVLQALLMGLAGGLQAGHARSGAGIEAAALMVLCSPGGEHGRPGGPPGSPGSHHDAAADPCCLAGCGAAPAAMPERAVAGLAHSRAVDDAPPPRASPDPVRSRAALRPLGARAPPAPVVA